MFKFNFLEKIFEQFGVKLSLFDRKNKLENSVIKSNQQTGNINNIYNAPVNISVGNSSELLGKLSQPQKTYYTEGLELLGLTKNQVQEYGDFLDDFYKKIYNKSNREFGTTKNPYHMIKGAIFAVGSKKDNIDWKRHASSSLREIIYVWRSIKKDISNDFSSFYKKDTGLNNEERKLLMELLNYYEYFSSIHHNDEVGIVYALQTLENRSTLEIDDCLKSDVFIKQIKDFLNKISDLSTVAIKDKT